MSIALVGRPEEVTEQILARYEPLRDSRVHAEPERQQRKLFHNTAYLFLLGGMSLVGILIATARLTPATISFAVLVLALGLLFWRSARLPLRFVPPEPLENLPLLSQALGLARSLAKEFPDLTIELEPISSSLQASCDGYDWKVNVQREKLRRVTSQEPAEYESYVIAESESASRRAWRRSAPQAEGRHRLVWTVVVDGDFTPRPGQPSNHCSLESCQSAIGVTECSFTLPITEPDQPGLGHEGRTDYISSPLGLHHPEFVGEQIAVSLAWMFKPNLRF